MSEIKDLKFDDKNFNKHTERGLGLLGQALQKHGAGRSILIDKNNNIIAGNGVVEAAGQIGLDKVKVVETTGDEIVAVKRIDVELDSKDGREMAMEDNAIASIDLDWDEDLLKDSFSDDELKKWNVDVKWNDDDILAKYDDAESGSMVKNFGAPPFSILDTRQGYWQEKRKEWLDLGIKSELGRDDDLLGKGLNELAQATGANVSGTSVFDPYLCEILYRWFAPENAEVLDPFAGGSVRGILASKLGNKYTGIELRKQQVDANRKQVADICKENTPKYICGDSNVELDKLENNKYDFVFSCPPYADLEEYSDDPADLSTMDYEDFKKVYGSIIKKSIEKLKDNRFACFVVSEVRAHDGTYYNFVSDTIKAFQAAGTKYYNEIILINSATTLSLRAGRIMRASRKVGRTHQNILVFFKGDTSTIRDTYKDNGIKGEEEAGQIE